jgi:hypothetical protein
MSNGSKSELRFAVALGDLSFSAEGDRDAVFAAWKEFLANAAVRTKSAGSAAPPATANTPPSPAGNSRGVQTDSTEEPLNLFLERTGRSSSNPQIATAIVLWAKRTKRLDEIEPSDVKEFWRDTKHKVPGNVPRELATAVKEGWLTRAGGGRYRITGHGESFIGA